ncbi:hypothetical protein H7U19_01425 [Hyunsoonleella sp. SJ7]|uniref:Tail specific protease domain-containing protein n=1 Tax=Hyunsoonleella aquatilis TaxID=2762758 RepID=A0A923H9W7_9FLAO|nr:S41 family peptidase [Hyunsoonleella aquatilis]MBC3757046.1 hypothetical protein [Hyunsoonleella aquatilis]
MKVLFKILLLFSIIGCSSPQNYNVTPKQYMDEVFEIVEKKSIRKDAVDLSPIKKLVYEKLKSIDSIEECYPLIESTLIGLQDHHSFFMPKNKVVQWKSTSKTKNIYELMTFTGTTLNKDIGYISMRGFNSGDSISMQKYADSLQDKIKSIDSKNVKGWILDLRENNGGNCWPMLAGIGPLLGNGICGYFIDNDKRRASWFYADGASGIDSFTKVKVSKKPYALINEDPHVAVLTSPSTCSSGEVVATAFHNKENTRSFGKSTAGLTTGNAQFKLSDGSAIFLATSIYVDREGVVFGGKISPDETIDVPFISVGLRGDPVVERAIEWIYEQKQNMLRSKE